MQTAYCSWAEHKSWPIFFINGFSDPGLEEVATPLVAAETVPMYVSTQGDPLEVGKEPTEADADETQSSVKFEIEIEDGVVEGENDETQRLEYIKSIRLTPEQLVICIVMREYTCFSSRQSTYQ